MTDVVTVYYVAPYHRRKKLAGYSVFEEQRLGQHGMVQHGKCRGSFDFRDYSPDVALHLANTMRDDLKAGIS